MTHVTNPCTETANDKNLKEYMVEVITHDNESVTVWVYAQNASEAQDMAADEVPDADYTMVQAVYSMSGRR